MLNRPVPKSSKLSFSGLLAIISIGAILLPIGCGPAGSTINEDGHMVDKIDYRFVNDPKAIGGWKAVDFVKEIEGFTPGQKRFKNDLYLHVLFLLTGGETNLGFTWTKGLMLHQGNKTASKYVIKEIDGVEYMFFEWKSGDYTIRHMRPQYYVLQKDKDMVYTTDKTDYPFKDDQSVIGTWKSVDYVDKVEQFKVGQKQWKGQDGELFLNDMKFEDYGKLTCKNDKVPNGFSRTWTKGLVLNKQEKNASEYHIKEIDGSQYLFYEWKSGDYTYYNRTPSYYVLKKVH